MSESKKDLVSLLQCGSCTFKDREKTFEKKCSELGKLPSSRACPSHKSDAFSLIRTEEDLKPMFQLGSILENYGPSELQALAALLLKEKQTRKLGFHFHQKVYLRLHGQVKSNYFNNFVIGYVLDATKEQIRIVGYDGRNVVCVYAINEPNSTIFYTLERFSILRDEMLNKSAYSDPERSTTRSTKCKMQNLGSADSIEALENNALTKRRFKRSPKDDLVSLVAKLSRGHLRKAKPSKATHNGEDAIRII